MTTLAFCILGGSIAIWVLGIFIVKAAYFVRHGSRFQRCFVALLTSQVIGWIILLVSTLCQDWEFIKKI